MDMNKNVKIHKIVMDVSFERMKTFWDEMYSGK